MEGRRILVHLGCGPEVQPSEWIDCDGSWNALIGKLPSPIRKMIITIARSLRIQLREWPGHVRFLNLRKRFPITDNSVDAIYASHVWEHLSRTDAERATKECCRILKEGGVLRLAVPDLRYFCESYLSSKDDDAADRFMDQIRVRSRGEKQSFLIALYTLATDFHSHKWMYDARTLGVLMTSSGFTDVDEKKCFESAIPEITQVESPGRVSPEAGIAIEGMKPYGISM